MLEIRAIEKSNEGWEIEPEETGAYMFGIDDASCQDTVRYVSEEVQEPENHDPGVMTGNELKALLESMGELDW